MVENTTSARFDVLLKKKLRNCGHCNILYSIIASKLKTDVLRCSEQDKKLDSKTADLHTILFNRVKIKSQHEL